jgi:long-chain acyl-CoA synthetase
MDYPDCSMAELILNTCERYPGGVAYTFMWQQVKYKRLADKIFKAAAAFEKRGITPGDRVLLCLPNVPQAVLSLYALNLLGAVAVFVHPLSSEGELDYFVKNSKAKLILTLDMFKDKFSTDIPIITKWNAFMRSGRQAVVPLSGNRADEPAVILYSGGTTGYPKGIVLSNLNFNALAAQTASAAGNLEPGLRMLAVMPIFHGFGLGICVHTALANGLRCDLVPRFSIKTFARKMRKANYIAGVPTLFEALLNAASLKNADLRRLKGVFCGGDTLPVSLKRRFDEFLTEHGAAVRLREGYGMTECVTASCLTPPDTEREGSIGLPYPDMFYKTLAGGELCLRGPSVMLGYLDDPTATANALQIHPDGHLWLHTGDLGRVDEDGYVYFLGRLKRVIMSSGYSVYPSQIERVLNEHPLVKNSCVIAVPHPYKMQIPKAFVVLCDSSAEVNDVTDELFAHLRRNVAKYALPRELVFIDALPTTKLGKVDYSVLETNPQYS